MKIWEAREKHFNKVVKIENMFSEILISFIWVKYFYSILNRATINQNPLNIVNLENFKKRIDGFALANKIKKDFLKDYMNDKLGITIKKIFNENLNDYIFNNKKNEKLFDYLFEEYAKNKDNVFNLLEKKDMKELINKFSAFRNVLAHKLGDYELDKKYFDMFIRWNENVPDGLNILENFLFTSETTILNLNSLTFSKEEH